MWIYKTLLNYVKYTTFVPVFPGWLSLVQFFWQILKYFAQSCDCMIAAFRNSGWQEGGQHLGFILQVDVSQYHHQEVM